MNKHRNQFRTKHKKNEEVSYPPQLLDLDPHVHVQQLMQQSHIGRVIHKSARYALLGETYQVILDYSDDEPTIYK